MGRLWLMVSAPPQLDLLSSGHPFLKDRRQGGLEPSTENCDSRAWHCLVQTENVTRTHRLMEEEGAGPGAESGPGEKGRVRVRVRGGCGRSWRLS